jgi:hypothetical protein
LALDRGTFSRLVGGALRKALASPGRGDQGFRGIRFHLGREMAFFDTMHFEYRPEILLLSNMNFKIST